VRALRSTGAVVVSLSLAVSCTSGPAELDPTTTGGPLTAEVVAPPAPTGVLDVPPGPEAAAATSEALFERAPVVVVAEAGDAAGTTTAATVAERLGVPVLLAPADGAESAPVERELARLSPVAVLAVGAAARRHVEDQDGTARVFGLESTDDGAAPPDLPDGLPDVDRPRPVAATVLVDAARDDAAAVATARAAGARVVSVRGSDPRADPAAIDALRADPPTTVLALGEDFGPPERLRARLDVAVRSPQLPGGGQVLFPGRRLVCLYGHPGAPALGVLGEQDLAASVARAQKLAAEYQPLSDVPVVPAFEIIATVARGAPGPDGDYSGETDVEALRPWVDSAGKAGLYVVLDLQPGRARLVDQARRYAPLLSLPHVGLAVDPEWKLAPDQVPLRQIGGVDAAEVNEVMDWLADLTAAAALPQKLFVVHQFKLSMIRDEASLVTTHDELALLIHMDGQGTTGQKVATWQSVVAARPGGVPMGWKNFYDEDHPVLTPAQTMAHDPVPVMISYQ
jgi:hypothetical protein